MSYRNGIAVFIQNQTVAPFYVTSQSGAINVATGLETYIGVRFTFNTIQDHCVACVDDLISFAKINSYSQRLRQYFDQLEITRYDQQVCIDMCYQDKLIESCGCCGLLTPAINKTKYCQDNVSVECEKGFLTSFSKSNVDQFCNGACVLACDTQTYSYSPSFASFPSDAYLSYLVNLVNNSDFKKRNPKTFSQESLIRLIVNYDTNSYTTITETTAMTLQQFIGQFGGNLGMFIGISVLSCLEIIELLVGIFQLTYTRIFNSESVNMINEPKKKKIGFLKKYRTKKQRVFPAGVEYSFNP